jgi:hypothetical protein
MRAKVAKLINKACRNEKPEFKNELKRTYNKVPRPFRNKFLLELKESCQPNKGTENAEQSA